MTTIHGLPFDFGGHLFAYTSIAADALGGAELGAYRLVAPETFRGGYANEQMGWQHGERIVWDGRPFVLQGPPAIFTAEPERPGLHHRTDCRNAPKYGR